MAVRGVSLAEKEDFILPHDPGHPEHEAYKAAIREDRTPEAPTIFYIGNLTKAQRVTLGDMLGGATMKDNGIRMEQKRTERAYATVQFGLKGWKNFLDADGKTLEFKATTSQLPGGQFVSIAADECIVHLSNEDIFLLADAILDKNGMGARGLGGLEGNFGVPLPQSVASNSDTGDAENASKAASKKKEAAKA